MPRKINISAPVTLLLSALVLSACASNSEPDAATPAQVKATQSDNNFGSNADTEKTTAPKAAPASATETTTRQSPSSKKQKAVKKPKKAVKKPEPAQ